MPSAIGSFWEWVGALGHLDARLCGVVSRFKRGREIGLRAFGENIKAIAEVGHSHDFTHLAFLVDEARDYLSNGRQTFFGA